MPNLQHSHVAEKNKIKSAGGEEIKCKKQTLQDIQASSCFQYVGHIWGHKASQVYILEWIQHAGVNYFESRKCMVIGWRQASAASATTIFKNVCKTSLSLSHYL